MQLQTFFQQMLFQLQSELELVLLALGWLLLRFLGANLRRKLVKVELGIENISLKKNQNKPISEEDIKKVSELMENDIEQRKAGEAIAQYLNQEEVEK
jgi:hypothetical protein